jgi:hypothetical protein
MRKFYVRIEEPLARTMERYAEFLGTDNLDHVVSQALQFIFKRDSQFKFWLEQKLGRRTCATQVKGLVEDPDQQWRGAMIKRALASKGHLAFGPRWRAVEKRGKYCDS